MTLDESLIYTRQLLRDMTAPYIWSDEVVVGYLNEAQERVARKCHSFVSDTRDIYLSAGEDIYQLDDDIIYIYSVRLDGYNERLSPSTDGWTPVDGSSARPTRYTLDTETQSIRFYSIPDADYTAIMRVARLPVMLSVDDLNVDLEVRPTYQFALSDWAAYRCFTHDDADGRNDQAAEKAKQRFVEAISEVKHDNYRQQTGHVARVHGLRVK